MRLPSLQRLRDGENGTVALWADAPSHRAVSKLDFKPLRTESQSHQFSKRQFTAKRTPTAGPIFAAPAAEMAVTPHVLMSLAGSGYCPVMQNDCCGGLNLTYRVVALVLALPSLWFYHHVSREGEANKPSRGNFLSGLPLRKLVLLKLVL